MIKLVKTEKQKKTDTKRYSIATVAQAIGRSEGSLNGFFSNRNVTVKGGITIQQIDDYLQSPSRGAIINWNHVEEIRSRLAEEYGYELVITEENIP